MSWTCPATSVVCVLVTDGEPPSFEMRKQALRETDLMVRSWACKKHIDMKWTTTSEMFDTWKCGTVHSTNFENECTQFPREFLDAFVGKQWRLLDSSHSIVISTCS
jgi:hypothetical protein